VDVKSDKIDSSDAMVGGGRGSFGNRNLPFLGFLFFYGLLLLILD